MAAHSVCKLGIPVAPTRVSTSEDNQARAILDAIALQNTCLSRPADALDETI